MSETAVAVDQKKIPESDKMNHILNFSEKFPTFYTTAQTVSTFFKSPLPSSRMRDMYDHTIGSPSPFSSTEGTSFLLESRQHKFFCKLDNDFASGLDDELSSRFFTPSIPFTLENYYFFLNLVD